jgi:hypothetical protein
VTAFHLLALLAAGALVGTTAVPEAPAQALVVVALPANATSAMAEALNRLRGEAISVGFEVRLVDATTESLSLAQLDGISAGLLPAAVVAISPPSDEAQVQHAFDVWFLDRRSGKASVAHLDAREVADAPERADVVVAVRAVDFIRARMFDTLAGLRAQPAPSPPPVPKDAPFARYDLAAGLVVLGAPSGFAPSLTPQIAAGYRPAPWLRVGLTAFGLGTEPERRTQVGGVSLGQRFVGASVSLLGRKWHRLQPMVDVGGGEHWVIASGDGTASYVGRTVTLSSPAASALAGLLFDIAPHLALELRGGTLWLLREASICATPELCLGSLGRPLWFGGGLLTARF